MVSASVNSSTVRSRRMASIPGRLPGLARTSHCSDHHAITRPTDRADGRQHHRLGQQLPHHPGASRAERDPDGELPPPRRAAAEQQAGNVRARNGQDERHRAEQHRHRLARLPKNCSSSGDQRRAASAIVAPDTAARGAAKWPALRDGPARSSRHPSAGRPRAGSRSAGCSPGWPDRPASGGYRRSVPGTHRSGPVMQTRRRGHGGPVEFGGHDRHDRAGRPVQHDLAADNRPIAGEPPRPQPVAQDDVAFVGPAGVEGLAEERRRPEHVEEARRHARRRRRAPGRRCRSGSAGSG